MTVDAFGNKVVSGPTTAKADAPAKYLVVKLHESPDTTNDILAAAAAKGYTTVQQVYVANGPSGTGSAYALLSA